MLERLSMVPWSQKHQDDMDDDDFFRLGNPEKKTFICHDCILGWGFLGG